MHFSKLGSFRELSADRGVLVITVTLSQSAHSTCSKRPLNLAVGTHLGIRNLSPKHVGRKENSCNCQISSKEIRSRVYYKEL